MRIVSRPIGHLRGTARPIGDKSLTHRGLILASVAEGPSAILGANLGDDCRATARACDLLGATVRAESDGWTVVGAPGALRDPEYVLDLGNSGTGIRLMAGFVAGQSRFAVLTGDASLRGRPMRRIADPLSRMGMEVILRDGAYPPIALRGKECKPVRYAMPIASAQVKSCCLLAALGLREGAVVLEEPGPSRDHTERLLAWLGVDIDSREGSITLRAPIPAYRGFEFHVPSDISAAAFYLVAGAILPGSDIVVKNVLLNPTRTGCIDVLRSMGARIEIEEEPVTGPEPVGTIHVRSAPLHGTRIEGSLLIRALDEVPILSVAAASAAGETIFSGGAELRVKESDRIESSADLARVLGAEAETLPDGLVIRGKGNLSGGAVQSRGDHRIAMSALVAGCAANAPVVVDDARSIATSDPEFLSTLSGLGADLLRASE
jgi:3-phosphoshikimate 1-carboxyvinyltransferase